MDFAQEFTDRKVIVTGAAGIIGRWLARGFAARGARLCLSDRNAAMLHDVASDMTDPLIHATELTDPESIADLVRSVREAWGAPDIVINNAGVYPSGWLLDTDIAEWDRIMGVNLRAPFLLTRDLSRLMIDRGQGGAFVNISSGAARKMRTTVVPYCVSKTALDRLTKGFALELAEYGIRVNALEPGFAAGSEASPLTDAHVEATRSAIPLGRETSAEDVVAAALYLCSDAASYATGSTLSVDGGNAIGSRVVHQAKKRAL